MTRYGSQWPVASTSPSSNSLILEKDEGNHFAFHKVTENRDRNNLPDMKDMNFSSIGHYPYKTKYDDLGQFFKSPSKTLKYGNQLR